MCGVWGEKRRKYGSRHWGVAKMASPKIFLVWPQGWKLMCGRWGQPNNKKISFCYARTWGCANSFRINVQTNRLSSSGVNIFWPGMVVTYLYYSNPFNQKTRWRRHQLEPNVSNMWNTSINVESNDVRISSGFSDYLSRHNAVLNRVYCSLRLKFGVNIIGKTPSKLTTILAVEAAEGMTLFRTTLSILLRHGTFSKMLRSRRNWNR